MIDLNKALKNGQIYSIEYCGYFILKLSVSSDLIFSKNFEELRIEFISGVNLFQTENNNNKIAHHILELYGTSVLDAKFTSTGNIELLFSNGYKISSLKNGSVLTDRDWLLYSDDFNENYVINDGDDLFVSDSFKVLLS